MSAEKEQIESTAYRIWEERGRPAGRDLDHWLEAEAQVKGAKAKGAAKPAARTAKPKNGDAKPAAAAKEAKPAKPTAAPKAKPSKAKAAPAKAASA
ncbi:MAG: DUF2934 domain-containing protein [Solirubrobacterales bacterium]